MAKQLPKSLLLGNSQLIIHKDLKTLTIIVLNEESFGIVFFKHIYIYFFGFLNQKNEKLL